MTNQPIERERERERGAFSLVELLVVIAIIGLLSTIVIVSFTGIRQSALSAKGKSNQHTANVYCTIYPGVSYPNGDQTQPVYCDNNSVMWSPTLAGTYQWKTENTTLPTYAKGDCNNLKDKDIVDYPACQACRNLNYAGFSEGWYLPSQRKGVLVENCNNACARDGENVGGVDSRYCAPGRQLWDYGLELCLWDPNDCIARTTSCLPAWEGGKAKVGNYWSATQNSATGAWNVNFSAAGTGTKGKTTSYYVRCVLGSYNK